jgi:hypothetical protein
MKSNSDLTSANTYSSKSSVSETGHYKNVVNFKKLKISAEGLGASYSPQKEILKLSFIETLLTDATKAHDEVKAQVNTVALAIDNRQLVFENIKPLATRVINTMSSTDVDQKTIEDAKSINAKIQGARIDKKDKSTDTEENNNSISVSRQSYDSYYENFKSLGNLLEQDGNYNPLEEDINIVGLTTKKNEMLASNVDVTTKNNTLETLRIVRNKILYTNENSVIVVAKGVKKYIRGKFGISSPEFAQIKNLEFKDLSKKSKK